MRALCLTTSFPASPEDPAGGFVEELASALRPEGVDTWVAALPAGPRGALETARTGHAVDRLALAARGVAWGVAARRLAVQRPHVVLAHWPLPTARLAAAIAPGVPIVGVAHGGDGRLAVALPGRLASRLVGRLAGLVAVAPWLAARFESPRTLVTPMGVWAAPGRAPRPRAGPLRALFVGRDDPAKGLATLLEAVARCPADVALTVVGSHGPPIPRVCFWGPQPPSGVRAALAEADVLCVPSRVAEGSPRVLAEAGAHGVRVLAAGVGGIPDVVPPEALVTPNTPDGWAAALSREAPGAQPTFRVWSDVARDVAGLLRAAAGGS